MKKKTFTGILQNINSGYHHKCERISQSVFFYPMEVYCLKKIVHESFVTGNYFVHPFLFHFFLVFFQTNKQTNKLCIDILHNNEKDKKKKDILKTIVKNKHKCMDQL